MNDPVEILKSSVSRQGYRLTLARQAIIETLAACGGHITADALAQQVWQRAPNVGRMTVYRTLELLVELGLIRPVYQGTGAAHFVLLLDGGHHHHFICNRCHEVIEFGDCFDGALIEQLSQQYQFQVRSHLLELHGLCERCFAEDEA